MPRPHLFAVAMLSVPILPAQIRLLPAPRLQVPATAMVTERVAVGDVNGDGMPDIVTANTGTAWAGQQNRLYLNDGFGGLIDATATHMPVQSDSAYVVRLGDIDGDGDLDLFTADWGGSNHAWWLYVNDGLGQFTDATAARLPAITWWYQTAVFVDLDHDGDLDLVARDKVLRNDGTGHFTEVPQTLPSGVVLASGMAAGDFDGDGKQDLIYTTESGYGSTLLLGNGNGTFANATANLPAAWSLFCAHDPVVGDIDGDGDLDVYLPRYGLPAFLLQNNGSGWFTDISATNLPATANSYGAAMADFDGDGDLDIIRFNGYRNASQTDVLVNDGTGRFTLDPAASPAGNLYVGSGAVADFDLDGDADVVLFGNNIAGVVWMNTRTQCYAANAPQTGSAYQLDYWTTPGANAAVLCILGLVPQQPQLALPPLGFSGIAPGAAAFGPVGAANTAGSCPLSLPVPNNPLLVGLHVYLQGLVVETGLRLTNTFPDRVR